MVTPYPSALSVSLLLGICPLCERCYVDKAALNVIHATLSSQLLTFRPLKMKEESSKMEADAHRSVKGAGWSQLAHDQHIPTCCVVLQIAASVRLSVHL